MKRFFTIAAASMAVMAMSVTALQDKDIVDLAVGTPSLSTLVKLVSANGLVKTLKSKGPFTVLAPNDDAFTAPMQNQDLQRLISSHKGLIKNILLYHVIKGSVMASDLKNGEKVKTVEGEMIKVKINDDGVFFNGNAKVVAADIKASNGVVHIVDNVLLPPSVSKMLAKEMKEMKESGS